MGGWENAHPTRTANAVHVQLAIQGARGDPGTAHHGPIKTVPNIQEDLLPENIKQNNIGRIIEKEVPKTEPGTKREYHAFTRYWCNIPLPFLLHCPHLFPIHLSHLIIWAG